MAVIWITLEDVTWRAGPGMILQNLSVTSVGEGNSPLQLRYDYMYYVFTFLTIGWPGNCIIGLSTVFRIGWPCIYLLYFSYLMTLYPCAVCQVFPLPKWFGYLKISFKILKHHHIDLTVVLKLERIMRVQSTAKVYG